MIPIKDKYNVTSYIEQIQETTSHKTTALRPPTSRL